MMGGIICKEGRGKWCGSHIQQFELTVPLQEHVPQQQWCGEESDTTLHKDNQIDGRHEYAQY